MALRRSRPVLHFALRHTERRCRSSQATPATRRSWALASIGIRGLVPLDADGREWRQPHRQADQQCPPHPPLELHPCGLQAIAIRLALPPAAVVLIEVETSSSSQSSRYIAPTIGRASVRENGGQ